MSRPAPTPGPNPAPTTDGLTLRSLAAFFPDLAHESGLTGGAPR